MVQQALAWARLLVTDRKKKVAIIDNLAYGLHYDDTSQLLNYGISLKRNATPKAIPSKGVIKNITDDYDGEGYILDRETITEADYYEWQKAKGDDAAVTNIDESKFIHFKVTRLKAFVDYEIKKGIRFFYRFRGFNSSSNGD